MSALIPIYTAILDSTHVARERLQQIFVGQPDSFSTKFMLCVLEKMSHMRHLQQEMKDALEFYANLAVHSASSDEFWGKYNAHVTFNALFYNGIVSEKERTAENKVAVNKTPENKVLDPSIFDDAPQLFQWAKILQYACWYFASQKSVTTYRICRKVDADALLAQNRTISFTSTSYKILSNRADKISNPVLLIFHISPRTPCVDIAAAFVELLLEIF